VYPGPPHTYADFYNLLFLARREQVSKVFEFGIGTTNLSLPASMGKRGQPGASLRVWRDYFPNAMIYGADIDRSALFTEERISTFWVDQLDRHTVDAMWKEVDEDGTDIIIDDGLHTFEAGSSTFLGSIENLSPLGTYVIEDVLPADVDLYRRFFERTSYCAQVLLGDTSRSGSDNDLILITHSEFRAD
jgi:hypothetical protein